MSKQELLYRVEFIQAGQRYELYARELSQGGLFGFIEIGDFVWDTHTSVVLDPSHEKLKDEFADVTRTYIPMHAVLRIDSVTKKGLAKITEFDGKIATFPSPIYTPTKDN
ncbi:MULTISPECIES: DUF1820 family protein [unclassified Methylophaga]|uniref:DUF1820 family protein n=1 Tax=unclassified Methylophaga TaxID=2629249 RepID=UPI000C665917|nr:DUF1820 family protein [Methylophaga sp. UBA678]MAX53853.1 hypothetical protein [Methylophaga sp.]|tara:strand:- start:9722 stop:10051 length:330 start_codon:yes stop_codon:yes gene_type:complete